MELPVELKDAIEYKIQNMNLKDLVKHSENISDRYRNAERRGQRLLTKEEEAVSYAAVRMPATYGAVYTCLRNSLERCDFEVKTLLDVGAGTGAGSWAACGVLDDVFDRQLDLITCIERETVMMNLGSELMKYNEDVYSAIRNANWKQRDIVLDKIEDKADLVICSYVLNEMPELQRDAIVKKLYDCANKVLVIIEPGTPEGFKEIKDIRDKLIKMGGKVVAPCVHSGECMMPENDWCHSTCRISRSKIHKILKNGDVPYEDEKFSYIVVSKVDCEDISNADKYRVLRHPKIESGRISVEICGKSGILTRVVTKKEKELFKIVRKINCGDLLVEK